jgi:ribosomal protein S18 acetylase RimI-like enzyme
MYRILRDSAIAQDGLEELCVNEENLREDGFVLQPPRFHALLAEAGGEPVAIALYFFTYSTWTSRSGVYLEDLYVAAEHRRHGVARALMVELARIAESSGCRYIRWLVLKENTRAVHFYRSLGVTISESSASMGVYGDDVALLAAQA